MKKLNRSGFTLIELTASILILGILMLIGIAAITTYMDQSRKQAYDTMARSASEAAEEYIMDSSINYVVDPPEAKTDATKGIIYRAVQSETSSSYVYQANNNDPNYYLKNFGSYLTYEELVEEGYLKEVVDPADKGQQCDGKVVVHFEQGDEKKGILDKFSFIVYEWCSVYSARYIFYYATVIEKQKVRTEEGTIEVKDVEVIKPLSSVTIKKDFIGERPGRYMPE